MTENKKVAINVAATVINFIITVFISLFVTPYIVNRLGGEAYGFVGLANNFVSYAVLITVALNAMESRFVSISIYQNDYENANSYFTSIFFANALIAVVLAPIMAIIVWKLQLFIEIPDRLITDVKLTFIITFIQFIASILLSRYEIATFVTNRLYLAQRNSIISSFIRLILILIAFKFFATRITFVVAASFAGVFFTYVMNFYYTKKFLPDLKINRKYFDFGHIKKVVASGVWSLVSKLSGVLLDGLDLLLANIFIGPVEMGALALSKTVPAMFFSLRGTLDYPFTPPMTKCYAEGDLEGVVKNARLGNKVLGIFMIAPMATFAVYGKSFFTLWVPGENGMMIQALALLAILSLLSGACINSVFTVFTVTNKVRIPALTTLATGILTVITNFILLNVTNWGVYIIAGVSSAYSLLRNYIFTPLYGAHCLKIKKSTFYHEIITGNICLVLNLIVGFLIYKVNSGSTWPTLILFAGITGCLSIIINFFIVLSKSDRAALTGFIKNKLSHK